MKFVVRDVLFCCFCICIFWKFFFFYSVYYFFPCVLLRLHVCKCILLASKASPHCGVEWETLYAAHGRMWCVFIYLYISAVRSYTGEYTEDFTDSTRYGGHPGGFTIEALDSEIVVNDEENVYGFVDGCWHQTCPPNVPR